MKMALGKKNRKEIIAVNIETTEKLYFISAVECSRYFNVNVQTILNVLLNKSKHPRKQLKFWSIKLNQKS